MQVLTKEEIRHDLVTWKHKFEQSQAELDQVKGQLNSLFERVSGCEVSEFDSEQVKYLADMIEGQMDADNGAIEKLKSMIEHGIGFDELHQDSMQSNIN
jgi:hypothetical protein